jgi:hypothetical protein
MSILLLTSVSLLDGEVHIGALFNDGPVETARLFDQGELCDFLSVQKICLHLRQKLVVCRVLLFRVSHVQRNTAPI